MKASNQSVRLAFAFGFGVLLIFLVGFSNLVQANAFEPILFTYLVEEKKVTLPPGPIEVNGVGTVKSDSSETIQVPGCTDGDMTAYPIQTAQFHNIPKKKTFTPGGPVSDIILISQTEPFPEGTHFQVFTLEQCTSGGQLYDKILAATVESIPFIPDK